MKTEPENKYEEIEKPLKKGSLLLLFGIPFCLLMPILFTLKLEIIDFTNTGNIGDTIGGITSPFIGILGSILVFLALKAQIQANIIVQKQIDSQESEKKIERESVQLNQFYTNLKSSIDNFNYSTLDTWELGETNHEFQGTEAFYKLFQDFYCNFHIEDSELNCNPKITEVISILEICDTLLTKISKSDVYDKETLWTLTSHQFIYRVFPRLSSNFPNNLNKKYCESCSMNHGLPDKIVLLIKSIKEKTDKGLVGC